MQFTHRVHWDHAVHKVHWDRAVHWVHWNHAVNGVHWGNAVHWELILVLDVAGSSVVWPAGLADGEDHGPWEGSGQQEGDVEEHRGGPPEGDY